MIVDDTGWAATTLRQINYYRLNGYWYSFRQLKANGPGRVDTFIAGSTLRDVVALYDFDVRLRTAVFAALAPIELSMRALLGHELGTTSRRSGGRFMDDTEDHNVQAQPRWPWFAAGGLLFASAAVAAVSVHLPWLPCRGSMLDETVFAPKETKEINEACLRQMDEGFPFLYFPEDVGLVPSASELGGLAMVFAAASWIVLVLGLRLRRETKMDRAHRRRGSDNFRGLELVSSLESWS